LLVLIAPVLLFVFNLLEAAPGVKTIGIYELINFMQTEYAVGEGIIVDARPSDTYEAGTIPGSINIPYTRINRRAGANDMDYLLQLFADYLRKAIPRKKFVISEVEWKTGYNMVCRLLKVISSYPKSYLISNVGS